jgi:hypothetical protein
LLRVLNRDEEAAPGSKVFFLNGMFYRALCVGVVQQCWYSCYN